MEGLVNFIRLSADRVDVERIEKALACRKRELGVEEQRVLDELRKSKAASLLTKLAVDVCDILLQSDSQMFDGSTSFSLSDSLPTETLENAVLEALHEIPLREKWVEKSMHLEFGDDTPCASWSDNDYCYYTEYRSRMPQVMTLQMPVLPSKLAICDECFGNADPNVLLRDLICNKTNFFELLDAHAQTMFKRLKE